MTSLMKLDDYRLRTQIIVFSIIIMTAILGGLILSIILFINKMQEAMQISSLEVFENETSNQLQKFIQDQNRLALQILKDSYTQEKKVNYFFQIIEQGKVLTDKQAYDCLMDSENSIYNDTYSYKASFCYLYHNVNPLDKEQYALNLNLSSLLSQYYMIFDFFTAYIAYADIRIDYQYYTLFPGDNYTGFQTHLRPWFINHLANMADHKSVIGYPYQGYTGDIFIAQTLNMTFLNGSLAGVISQDYTFADFPKIHDPSVNFVIVNQTGHVIMSKYELPKNSIICIYEESYTGFNYNQWMYIKNYSSTNSTFQTFNSQLNRQVYIMTRQWIYPNFILLIYKDDSEYQYELQLINHYFENTIQNLIATIILILSISCLVAMIIQIALIYIILQKVALITKSIIYKIQPENMKKSNEHWSRAFIQKVLSRQRPYSTGTVEKLLQSYIQMTANITQLRSIHPTVNHINQIQYPQINYHKKQVGSFRISYIQTVHYMLKDQELDHLQNNSFSFANSVNQSQCSDYIS